MTLEQTDARRGVALLDAPPERAAAASASDRRLRTVARTLCYARLHWCVLALGGLTAVFAAFRIWRAVSGGPIVWNDTFDYEGVAQHSWFSRLLWAGARPPITPLLWKLTGSNENFVVTQTVIGVICWAALAWSVARFIRPGWRAFVASTLVLAMACCWPVTQWDSAILSESISLSAMAALMACLLALSRGYSKALMLGTFASAIVFAGSRDENIVTIAIFGAAIAAYGAARLRRQRWHQVARITMFGLTLLATAGLIESAALVSRRNVVNVENIFAARIFPFPGRVAWFAARGMPEAAHLDTMSEHTAPNPGYGKLVYPALGTHAWHPLAIWFSDDAEGEYLVFLVSHPGYDLTAPFVRPELTFNDFDGDVSLYGAGVYEAPGIAHVLYPAWGVVLGVGLAGAAGVLVRRLWKRRDAWLLAGLALTGLFSMLVAWHGDGQEIVRHMIEGEVMARVAALLLLLAGLFGLAPPKVHTSEYHEER